MSRTLSTTTQSPSVVIVQGTYKKFFAPAKEVATVFANVCDFGLIWAYDESAALAAIHEDWLRFQGLVTAWHQERGAKSSITEGAICPAYQSIIGMGEVAIPFIVATLKSEGDNPDQWFWALKAITGVDPVMDADRGNYRAMAAAWIGWATRAGYAR